MMTNRLSRSWRSVTVFAIAALAVGGALFGWSASSAAAEGATLTASVRCDPSTYTLSWTLTTNNVPFGEFATVTLVSESPTSTVTGLPQVVSGNNISSPITQSGIPASSTSASLTVHLHWLDNDANVTGTVSLSGNGCSPPTTTTTVRGGFSAPTTTTGRR